MVQDNLCTVLGIPSGTKSHTYEEPPKKKSFPQQKNGFFACGFDPKLPPDTENWSAEAFLDIITKKQKNFVEKYFSQNLKK